MTYRPQGGGSQARFQSEEEARDFVKNLPTIPPFPPTIEEVAEASGLSISYFEKKYLKWVRDLVFSQYQLEKMIDFISTIENTTKRDITLLSPFYANNKPITIKCNLCGEVTTYSMAGVLKNPNHGCKCQVEWRKGDNKRWEEIFEPYKEEYELIGEFVNQRTKVSLLHKKCGKIWEVYPYQLIKGTQCGHCAKKNCETKQDILAEELLTYTNGEYQLINYIDYDSKAKVKHVCGHIIEDYPLYRFMHEDAPICPVCFPKGKSKKEAFIVKLLTDNNIPFKQEVVFDDCIGLNDAKLRFDFVVYKDSQMKEISHIIEVDGKQHYQFNDFFFKDMEDFNKSTFYDMIKNTYCFQNNIPLLRIAPTIALQEINIEYLMLSPNEKLEFYQIDQNATLPKKSTVFAAGYDLFANEDCILLPNQIVLVGTGIIFKIPSNYMGLLFVRSSTPLKKGLNLANGVGVIDSDYRDEIKFQFQNLTEISISIEKGEKLGQILILQDNPFLDDKSQYINAQHRIGGFGSTGN